VSADRSPIDRFFDGNGFRIAMAAIFSFDAILMVFEDRHWNLPYALFGFAALISIATLVIPRGWGRRILERYRARK
jgi:hypothetical protein